MKRRTCLLLAVALAVLLFPAATSAQPMVSGFQGTVTAGGAGIPDNTLISAWIDDIKVAETRTSDSMFSMFISGDYADKTVIFKVGKYDAEQTATWKQGETVTVNLIINSWPYQCDFYGVVTVDGNYVPDGTEVSAWIDSARIQTTTTTDSLYRLVIPGDYTEKAVAFKIGNSYATQIIRWERGREIEANLTVSLGPLVCGFYGTVKLDGEDVIDGTVVSAWIDSVKVQTTTTTDSKYGVNIPGPYTGKTVTFQVAEQWALESAGWVRGGNEQVSLRGITTGPPIVNLDPSPDEVRPGEEFTLNINVDPNGHGISAGEIELFSVSNQVMEILIDEVREGTLLGSEPIEGIKEKTGSVGGRENLKYSIARKGTTPVPTETGTLATVKLRIRMGTKAGEYGIPNAVKLTDEDFHSLEFIPPTVAIKVIDSVPGDINGDGVVGLEDLAILASVYGTSAEDQSYRDDANLNRDDEVGLEDLAILAGYWGSKE